MLAPRFPNFSKTLCSEKNPVYSGRSGAKMGSAETSKTAFDQTEMCGVSTPQGQNRAYHGVRSPARGVFPACRAGKSMRFAYCHCMADGFVTLSCRFFPYTAIADGAFFKNKKKEIYY